MKVLHADMLRILERSKQRLITQNPTLSASHFFSSARVLRSLIDADFPLSNFFAFLKSFWLVSDENEALVETEFEQIIYQLHISNIEGTETDLKSIRIVSKEGGLKANKRNKEKRKEACFVEKDEIDNKSCFGNGRVMRKKSVEESLKGKAFKTVLSRSNDVYVKHKNRSQQFFLEKLGSFNKETQKRLSCFNSSGGDSGFGIYTVKTKKDLSSKKRIETTLEKIKEKINEKCTLRKCKKQEKQWQGLQSTLDWDKNKKKWNVCVLCSMSTKVVVERKHKICVLH